MKETNCPVVYDASHSVQRPGANKGVSSGDSKFIAPLAKAAVAVGIDALFIESHPDPSNAISDGDNCINLNEIESLISDVIKINNVSKTKIRKLNDKIKQIKGSQIIDSRGNPTCEADVLLDNGIIGRGAVPSGASTGKLEALELQR